MLTAEASHTELSKIKKDPSQYIIFTGNSHPTLAKTIGENLGIDTHKVDKKFSDGEIWVDLPVSVREKHVFIIQPTGPPDQDRYLRQLKEIAWTSIKCSAKSVTAVIPYLAYARADKMNRGRVPTTIEMVSNEIWMSGVNNIVTIDLHSEESARGYGGPGRWDNVYGSFILVPAVEEFGINRAQLRVISPDAGGVGRASFFNEMLKIPEDITTGSKRRNPKDRNDVKIGISGDFADKTPLIADDMIDTAGTVEKIVNVLTDKGSKPAFVVATHGVLSDPALKRLDTPSIRDGGILITDTIAPRSEVLAHPKIRVYSIAPLIEQVISRTINGEGMSELFSAVAPKVSRVY